MIFYFNPRPREEGDATAVSVKQKLCNFNPRPREEGDQQNYRRLRQSRNFNPRPREEGDITKDKPVKIIDIFQSTPS